MIPMLQCRTFSCLRCRHIVFIGMTVLQAATPTHALTLATRTEIVVFHAAEKRSDDQWYKSMSRSSPAKATHVLKKVFAADPQAPPTSTQKGTNFTSCATRSCRLRIASFHRARLSFSPSSSNAWCTCLPNSALLRLWSCVRTSETYSSWIMKAIRPPRNAAVETS